MAGINASSVLDAAKTLLALYAQAESLLPQVMADYQSIKSALSSDDDAAIQAAITQAHGLSRSLTDQLNALADPAPAKAK